MPLEQIKVLPTGTDQRVILWERHPEHPDGEVFLVNDLTDDSAPIAVAKTEEIAGKIRDGQLELVRVDRRARPTPTIGEKAVVATSAGSTAASDADETTQPPDGAGESPSIKPDKVK